MMLQALVEYYEDLERAGKISAPGWGPAKISYALYLSPDGQLEQVTCIKVAAEKGKKLVPQVLTLPAAVKRSVGIASNFLWDNAAYILGITAESDKAERALRCREALRPLNPLDGRMQPCYRPLFPGHQAGHLRPILRAVIVVLPSCPNFRVFRHILSPETERHVRSRQNIVQAILQKWMLHGLVGIPGCKEAL